MIHLLQQQTTISKIGWKRDKPCFYKVNLKNNIPIKYLNSSAKKLKNKRKLKYFEQYIKDTSKINLDLNLTAAIITPDKDIIPGSKNLYPAYIVFDNYELILKME